MKEFIVLTGESVITEKIMQAESLEKLIEKISNTQRGNPAFKNPLELNTIFGVLSSIILQVSLMEYQIYKNKPFNFENLLYTHHKKMEGIKWNIVKMN